MRNKNFWSLQNASNAGFSLIELMVVISVVALLSSVLIYSLVTARVKARMSRRAVDLNLLQKGLELYAFKNQTLYPNGGPMPNPDTPYSMAALGTFLVPDSLTQMPIDPGYPSTQDYQYAWGDGGKIYAIRIFLNNEIGYSANCVYRSSPREGVTNNLFSGEPSCNFE